MTWLRTGGNAKEAIITSVPNKQGVTSLETACNRQRSIEIVTTNAVSRPLIESILRGNDRYAISALDEKMSRAQHVSERN